MKEILVNVFLQNPWCLPKKEKILYATWRCGISIYVLVYNKMNGL